jgi:hypothetical protein
MPEHEPLDIASKDRAKGRPASRNDDAAAASEPMDLQRLPESKSQVPPGRQRTGDPPSPRSTSESDKR